MSSTVSTPPAPPEPPALDESPSTSAAPTPLVTTIQAWHPREYVDLAGILLLVVTVSVSPIFLRFGLRFDFSGAEGAWLILLLPVGALAFFLHTLHAAGPRVVTFVGDEAHLRWLWSTQVIHREDVSVETDLTLVGDDNEEWRRVVWVVRGERIRFRPDVDSPDGARLAAFTAAGVPPPAPTDTATMTR